MTIPEFKLQDAEGVFEQNYVITEDFADAAGQMQPGDFARLMEVITEKHLSFYGVRQAFETEKNKTWVIMWNSIEINRLPVVGERTVLRLWPGKSRVGLYVRYYGFYTEAGEKLAGAGSWFTVMDTVTRSISGPVAKMDKIPIISVPDQPKPPKMTMDFPEEMSCQIKRNVSADEIDKNGHLNNTHYIDWAHEIALHDHKDTKMPHEIWIRYDKELREGDCAVLHYEWQDNCFYIKGELEGASSFMLKATY